MASIKKFNLADFDRTDHYVRNKRYKDKPLTSDIERHYSNRGVKVGEYETLVPDEFPMIVALKDCLKAYNDQRQAIYNYVQECYGVDSVKYICKTYFRDDIDDLNSLSDQSLVEVNQRLVS